MLRLNIRYDSGTNPMTSYTYDALHRMTRIDLAATKLVASSDYTFDAAGRLTGLSHARQLPLPPGEGWGEGVLAGYIWTYDAAHRVTELTSLLDGTAEYAYDQTDQLTGADYTYQDDEAYGYDANGNRTMIGYATGDNNLVLSDGTYDYQYDAEGNRTRRTHIASGEVTDYHWDHRNRLTRVTVNASDQGHSVRLRWVQSLGARHPPHH